jgi:hypothetical protein
MSKRSKEALALKREAETQRLIAEEYRQSGTDMASVEFHDMEADRLEGRAADLLKVTGGLTLGSGGEVVEGKYAQDTLAQNPDAVNVAASAQRYDLIEGAGIEELAIDAAESVKAPNSLERMLCHQMALAHEQSFTLAEQANEESNTVEKVRLVNASARMMKAFQDALATLNRIRTGGKQVVVVQHVSVGNGGQALVTGQMDNPGGAKNDGG